MILGIDPGFGRVGFAVIKGSGSEQLVDMGIIMTESGEDFFNRLSTIRRELSELVAMHPITEVAIEQLFFSVNKKTAMDVAQARGVIGEVLYSLGFKIYEYSPSQIKKSVTGHAKADKAMMVEMMKKLFKVEFKKSYDDAYDALAIAFTHKYSLLRR